MDLTVIVIVILIVVPLWYIFLHLPKNSKQMLLIFDALFQIIKDTNDKEFEKEYGKLVSVYRDENGSFKNVSKDTIFQLKRDVRNILKAIRRKHPNVTKSIEFENDGSIGLSTKLKI